MHTRHYSLAARVVVVLAGTLGLLFAVLGAFWVARAIGYPDTAGAATGISVARLVQVVIGGSFCGLGAFIAAKARRMPGTAFLGAYLVAQGLATAYMVAFRLIAPPADPQVDVARLLVNLLAYGTALRAAQMFPRRTPSQRLADLRDTGRWGQGLSMLVRTVHGPVRVWALCSAIVLAVAFSGSDLLFHIGQGIAIVLVIATFLASYRTGNAISRKKIFWLLAGAQFLLIGRLLIFAGSVYLEWIGASAIVEAAASAALPLVDTLRLFVWTCANAGLLVCILLAVFYSGAVHPGIVIRRTAIYSTGIGFALFLFGVFVNYVSAVVADILQIQQTSIEAVAGALIALLLKPINDLLVTVLERIAPSARKDVTTTLRSEAVDKS